jgi:TonB family protein
MKSAMILCALAIGCSGTSRGLEAYRSDTQTLLGTRDGQIKSCYDEALASDAKVAGTVTVQFVVEKKSGVIASATVAKSTAPKQLDRCVLDAIAGLKLAPGDKHDGQATFTYEFKPPAA